MTEVITDRVGRFESTRASSGYDFFHARSRERGEPISQQRGERYGRLAGIRREESPVEGAGEMNEMLGNQYAKTQNTFGGRGGAGDSRGGRGGGGGGFQRPQQQRGGGGGGGAGFGGGSQILQVEEGGSARLLSNHFMLSCRQKQGKIYIYKVDFDGDYPAEQKMEAMRQVKQELLASYGLNFYHSGKLFSAKLQADVIMLTSSFSSSEIHIAIQLSNSFSLDDQSEEIRKKPDYMHLVSFVQKIVKRNLYEKDYKQIGRMPKFFNTSEQEDLNDFRLIMWPGYTCQVKLLNYGIFMNVDTCTKFLQQQSVLDLINGLLRDKVSKADIDKKLTPKWDDSKSQSSFQSELDSSRLVVITSYNSASYQIEEILWKETPRSIQFFWKKRDPNTGKVISNDKINLAEYLEARYSIKLDREEYNQPILALTHNGQRLHLIPSRCHPASLPKDFTKNAQMMRDLRTHMITAPIQRFNRIGQLIQNFSDSKFLQEWEIKVNQNFPEINTTQLYHPSVIDPQNKVRRWADYERNQFKHSEPLYLKKDGWALVYGQRDFDNANALFSSLQEASRIFGIVVEEPQWVEASSGNAADLIAAIKDDIVPQKSSIIVVILPKPHEKKDIKKVLDKGGVPSQFITAAKLHKARIGVFSNLLKQMNAKLKLDLYRVNLPHFKKTMLIGVDVIMNGRNKLVGCCATVTPTLTQCITKLYNQHPPEGFTQERKVALGPQWKEELEEQITIDRTALIKEFVTEAMQQYQTNNKSLPDQVVIYRDGMGGPTLTAKVCQYEVNVIRELLEQTTPAYKPRIIYCLVDRNIQHRLFDKTGTLNPGPGTILDTALVENQGDLLYDFFMVPHKATVATAQPVLYKVVYNTSSLNKLQFETSTYHLCHNYFNFQGPVKVPMVCMYAHKIALYAQENKFMPNEKLSTLLHFL
ncbi:hypothetical protein FGO68_gene5845 [Halteria grandinella]|uniref:Piwi domain-containing protein n=1 Tax=Halteria grandinella TaxID=5974 RepID=A0A8J8T6J3_HALGN|nr:hypothetical protein FGO68_gene5845 [Halteria grandinella]